MLNLPHGAVDVAIVLQVLRRLVLGLTLASNHGILGAAVAKIGNQGIAKNAIPPKRKKRLRAALKWPLFPRKRRKQILLRGFRGAGELPLCRSFHLGFRSISPWRAIMSRYPFYFLGYTG